MTKARILSFLMVVCLATTCMLSGTIAKYTTNDSNNDDAIVGKWGVILGIDGTLFGKNYSVDSGNTPTDATTGISVQSFNATNNVVAPGTKNDVGMFITLQGQPEVSVNITVDVEDTLKDVYLKNGTYAILTPINKNAVTEENFVADTYYVIDDEDIAAGDADDDVNVLDVVADWGTFDALDVATVVYVIDDVQAVVNETDGTYNPIWYEMDCNGTANDLTDVDLAAVAAKLESFTTTTAIVPNQNLSSDTVSALNGTQITWEWKFEDSKDAADTILGALIAGQKVVSITGGVGSEVYTVLVADDADAYSIEAAGAEVAYLKTVLDFEITVEQVD